MAVSGKKVLLVGVIFGEALLIFYIKSRNIFVVVLSTATGQLVINNKGCLKIRLF